jgi:hypothetical protein
MYLPFLSKREREQGQTFGRARFPGVEDGENGVYTDYSNVWQRGNNVEEVVRKLGEKAALFVDYRVSHKSTYTFVKGHISVICRPILLGLGSF